MYGVDEKGGDRPEEARCCPSPQKATAQDRAVDGTIAGPADQAVRRRPRSAGAERAARGRSPATERLSHDRTQRASPSPGYGPRARSAWGRLTARDSVVRRLDWLMLLSGARAVRRSARCWSGRRPATAPSSTRATRTTSCLRHAAQHRHRPRADGRHDLARPPHPARRGAGPVRRSRSCWSCWCSPRSARPSTARTPGSCIGGGFSLQPSEFVKITIILGMAMLLAARVDAGDQAAPRPPHGRSRPWAWPPSPMVVIMLMPDLGSVMVMVDHRARRAARLRRLQPLDPRAASARAPSAPCWSGSSGCSTSTRSTASPPSPTPSSTRPASATTPTRPGSRSAPAD